MLKNNIPGNKVENERRIREISQNAMIYEKVKHQNNYEKFRDDLETAKNNLKNQFSQEIVVSELNRFEKHLSKIETEMVKKKQKKIVRDEVFSANFNNSESPDVTIALDDEHQILAHKQKTCNGRIYGEVSSSSESSAAHSQSPGFEVNSGDVSLNVTIAHDDEHHIEALKRRKRKFKRFYNQPQPKKVRNRKKRNDINNNPQDNLGWNNSIKNVSGVNTSSAEELCYQKAKSSALLNSTLLSLGCKKS